MATVKQEIDVRVPLSTAYNQWTQFEELPRFMEGVKEVRQLDDAHLHWVAQIGSEVEEWDAEIVEQVPDRVIAWRSLGGKPTSGIVRFEPLGADETRVMVEMEYEPEGIMQGVGAAIGVDDRKTKADLERFKDLIEGRGVETGGWRGEIHGGHVSGGPHGLGPGLEGGESTYAGGGSLGGGTIGADEEYGLGGGGAESADTSLGDALDEDYEGMPIRDRRDRLDERDV